jgi:hypothetical protein
MSGLRWKFRIWANATNHEMKTCSLNIERMSEGSTIATFPLNFAEVVGQISRVLVVGLSRRVDPNQESVLKL